MTTNVTMTAMTAMTAITRATIIHGTNILIITLSSAINNKKNYCISNY